MTTKKLFPLTIQTSRGPVTWRKVGEPIVGIPADSVAGRHHKHAKAAGIANECAAHHVNFGGGCLNCGFDPKAS